VLRKKRAELMMITKGQDSGKALAEEE